jgi:hypothetical protein
MQASLGLFIPVCCQALLLLLRLSLPLLLLLLLRMSLPLLLSSAPPA